MKPSFLPTFALFGLAVGLSTSPAAADAPTLGKVPAVRCAAPTLASCTDDKQVGCTATHRDACKALVEAAWKDNPARAGAEVRPMLRVGDDVDIPKDLKKDGRFFPYTPTKSQTRKRTKQGLTVFDATIPAAPQATSKPAKSGHRNPTWEKNDDKVTTCEEYAYEMVYDWGRFVDSVALCDGDGACAQDVAMMKATPGIARRTLVRRDGVALTPQLGLTRAAVDKNALYGLDPDWLSVTAGDRLKPNPELAAMLADYKKGKGYRAISCPSCKGASESYADEWAYHEAMRQKLAAVSIEEFEEYARRRAEFERLYANWARAAWLEQQAINKKVAGFVQKAPLFIDIGERAPWDLFLDPWERADRFRDFETRFGKGQAALIKAFDGAKLAPVQVPSGLYYVAPPATQWGYGFIAPTLPPAKPKFDPNALQKSPVELCLADGPALARRGVHACALGAFLREEWRRKQRGQLSCLDPANHTCDWSPEMMRDRLLGLGEGYLKEQQRLKDECVAITRSGALPAMPISKVAGHLAAIKAKSAAATKALVEYELDPPTNGKGRRYGTSKAGHDAWGAAGFFESGYDYHFGWGVETIELSPDNLPCKLQGSTDNGISATATILKKPFTLVDAVLAADANTAGNGKLHLKAYVTVLGKQLFSPTGAQGIDITQIFNEEDDLYTKDTPRASFTFAAGPVPVTVAGWGQLTAKYRVHAEGRFATTCNPKNPEFALVAGFEPEVAANARAQIGVGISGVASAGIRGTINLLRVGFPLTARLEVILAQLGEDPKAPFLKFDTGLAVTLASLAGRMALYAEFLFFEDEWEIFSWSGVGPYRVELLKLFDVKMPMVSM